jgi:Na+/melibiose symporter-like transporter
MNTILKVFGFLLGVAIMVANPSMFMFICFAMAPSIVAYFIDRLPGKNTSTTVTLFNLAGVSIFVMQILHGSRSVNNIGDAINFHWFLVVYLFAGCGWFVVWIVPKIVISLSEYRIQRRIETMEEKIEELVTEWGEEVKG